MAKEWSEYVLGKSSGTPAGNDVVPYITDAGVVKFTNASNLGAGGAIQFRCGDPALPISAANRVATWPVPQAQTLFEVQAYLAGPATSGTFTVDINKNGVSILSTKLTIDAGEQNSVTAFIAPVISDAEFAKGDEISVDVDDAADGTASGLIISLLFAQAPAADTSPVITTSTLPDGSEGNSYSETIAVTGGDAPLAFVVQSGSLPTGLTLNATTGEISGTASAEGSYSFTIRVTDTNGDFDEEALEIEVLAPIAFLIDDNSLTTAVAYGVRKLRNAYSGAGIRVRRDSDDAQQDIGFDGEGLDWAAATSFASGADLFVTKWYDQSGNGNDLLQSTTGNQPGLDIANERVDFSVASETFLQVASTLDLSSTDAISIFSALVSGAVGGYVANHGNMNVDDSFFFGQGVSPLKYQLQMYNGAYDLKESTASAGAALFSAVCDRSEPVAGDKHKIWINGSTAGVTTVLEQGNSGVFGNVAFRLSGNLALTGFWDGQMKEFVIALHEVDNTVRGNVETNINDFYSIF